MDIRRLNLPANLVLCTDSSVLNALQLKDSDRALCVPSKHDWIELLTSLHSQELFPNVLEFYLKGVIRQEWLTRFKEIVQFVTKKDDIILKNLVEINVILDPDTENGRLLNDVSSILLATWPRLSAHIRGRHVPLENECMYIIWENVRRYNLRSRISEVVSEPYHKTSGKRKHTEELPKSPKKTVLPQRLL